MTTPRPSRPGVPEPETPPLFTLDAVSFSAGGRRLLGPLSMTLRAGRITGVIGHNGSGKSTLVKILARQQAPSAGRVLFAGTALDRWPSRAFAREVAYLPQRIPAADGMTTRDLVALGRYPWHGPLGRFGPRDRRAVDRALAVTDVVGLADRPVDTLSGGERQRAWLAMTVAQEARCLLLDEPTSALDLAHQEEVLSLARRMADEAGLSILVVLHDINLAARHCDDLIALKGGAVIARGPAGDLLEPATLETIYAIPMGTLAHPDGGPPLCYVRHQG